MSAIDQDDGVAAPGCGRGSYRARLDGGWLGRLRAVVDRAADFFPAGRDADFSPAGRDADFFAVARDAEVDGDLDELV